MLDDEYFLKEKGISRDFQRFYIHKKPGYFLYHEGTRALAGFVESKAEAADFLDKNITPSFEIRLTFTYFDKAIVMIDRNTNSKYLRNKYFHQR